MHGNSANPNEMKEFFDSRAEKWDDICTFNQEKIAALITLAGVQPGKRIADIACGTGVLINELLSRNPLSVTGIDFSDEMIRIARGKFSDSRLQLLASNLYDIHETTFDIAIMFNAYPHFEDKGKLAKQIAFMLKANGRFMVAHGDGRDIINGCHAGESVSRISWPLRSAQEESLEFAEYFDIDMAADTSGIYFFSGTKKKL